MYSGRLFYFKPIKDARSLPGAQNVEAHRITESIPFEGPADRLCLIDRQMAGQVVNAHH